MVTIRDERPVSGREEDERFLSGDHTVQVLIVVLMYYTHMHTHTHTHTQTVGQVFHGVITRTTVLFPRQPRQGLYRK